MPARMESVALFDTVTFKCHCSEEEVSNETGSASSTKEKPLPTLAYYNESMWQELRSKKVLPVIGATSLSYEDFFLRYLMNNIPCLLSSDITSSWKSRQRWVTASNDNGMAENLEMVDLEYLLKLYGNAKVSAVNCADAEYKSGYGSRDCRDMLFSEYLQLWTARDLGSTTLEEKTEKTCLYLKDWHIVRFHATSLPNEPLPYEVPIYFKSDWLNEVCDAKNADDFKFCYIGPKGSFTSFHADVYGSYSWSANVHGVKRWLLYPPGNESKFVDSNTKQMKFNWDHPGTPGEDFIEVIQNAGECLFVPSGWHHVVWNLTDAISINHNWFNGANLCYIWRVLRNALLEVEKELEDLRLIPEFHEQCQLILKANHGMNYEDFFEQLRIIKEHRENTTTSTNFSSHANFDLLAIRHVVSEHCGRDPVVKMHFSESISALL